MQLQKSYYETDTNYNCDRDGVVTLKENRRLMKIRFWRKDLDEDGRLTHEELSGTPPPFAF